MKTIFLFLLIISLVLSNYIKMKNNYMLYFLVIILSIISISCDTVETPIELDNPSITYEVSGGFWGISQKLHIENSGLASYESIYPVLQLQLSEEEFSDIRSYLKDFESFKDNYIVGCFDDFNYKVKLKTEKKIKTVEFDGCAINKNLVPEQLTELANIFERLRIRIYNEKATWEGLSYHFSIDKDTFLPGDTITFFCKIKNPTDSVRKIFFKNKYQIQIAINNDTYDPHILFRLPDQITVLTETTSPSQLELLPEEEKEIKFVWGQSFINYDNTIYNKLLPGIYKVTIQLLGGIGINGEYPISNKFVFKIVNE